MVQSGETSVRPAEQDFARIAFERMQAIVAFGTEIPDDRIRLIIGRGHNWRP